MSKHVKDTDFLFISTRLRALEGRMLTRERRERMLEARSNEDAAKVLSECGYEGLEPLTAQGLEDSLRRARNDAFSELAELSPNPQIIDVFRIPYDYHNAKALVKCAVSGQEPERMLMDAGRIPAEKMQEALRKNELAELPEAMQAAIPQAQEVLAATGDPQKSDFVLDRACYEELQAMANTSGSDFLKDYVAMRIDIANLKAAVRSIRMEKNAEFMGNVLLPGGTIEPGLISAAASAGNPLESVFTGALQEAAALGDQTAKGGPQTAFERTCDDVLVRFLQQSRMTPFGDSVLISYAAAKENDISAARIIMSGRLAGVPTESIRERLREAYV